MKNIEAYLQEHKDVSAVWMDENRFAFLSNRSGYMQIWEKNIKSGDMRQRTFFESTVMGFIADCKNRQIIFLLDVNGSENGQPFILGYDDEEPIQLQNRPAYMHKLEGLSADGKKVYYLTNANDGIISDLCCYDLETSKETVLHKPEKPNALSSGMSPDRRYVLYSIRASYEENRLQCYDIMTGNIGLIPSDNKVSSEVNPHWSRDGKSVYVVSNRDQDLTFIARYDMETGAFEKVYDSPRGECRCVSPSPDGKYLVVAVNEDGYAYIDLLDGTTYEVIRRIAPIKGSMALSAYEYESVEWSFDSKKILFQMTNGTHPFRIWMYDIEKDSSEMVTDGGTLDPEDMTDMELREYTSFDGLRVPYFLILPKGREHEKKLPVLLEIHGGPESQRLCDYDAYLQYIVSRGIAVVTPNVRGSSGYGKAYCHMDDKEKRLDSVRDIEELVKHLVAEEIADPAKIAVSGISYGGFMTLSCCARLPELWACAVDRVGMYNLQTFMENTSPYRRAWRETEYGSLEDGDLLFRVSPAAKADQMKTPMIVVHGNNDPRVPVTETEQLVEMLRAKGVEVQFVRYLDEGHEVRKYPNILDSTKKICDFVLKYIGD